ncbi:MAG: hypothetical protein WD690_06245 [Vicinamibacterales bacterium]
MGSSRLLIAALVVALGASLTSAGAQEPKTGTGLIFTNSEKMRPVPIFNGLRWRSIGPYRGGRVTAVAGHRSHPHTFYMGATGGGVWKTTNAGHSWTNVSDGFFETASIGAIEVAESDPKVIYVGTGSAAIRSNVIIGRGMYRSTDAGETWAHIGLRDAGQIGALEIHPRDPNIAYAAALGSPFGPNPERGVFRTKDGGRTWNKVLFINEKVGAVALAMNPENPQEIYAGAWQAERKPWTIMSGGPAKQTGIYKTTDGGETWTHLTTASTGLPTGNIGKIDIDLARSKPSTVYALMEADHSQGGLYRSDDSGATWTRVSSDNRLLGRPFYYIYVDVDPKNPETVWVNNLGLVKSIDGGKTWRGISTPHGDNHGMWFNPDNPDILIQSNDGGANVSLDGGASWSTQWNQQTSELYGVETDNQFPYRVYAAQQDTGSPLIVPGRSPYQRGPDDPRQLLLTGPGCETGPVKPKIDDPNIIFGVCKGEFYRMSLVTGQQQSNWVYPQNRYGHASRDIKYRFQRVSPFEMSPHDSNVIYHGSHVLHMTRNGGLDWQIISGDLTANEHDYQGISGEPITRDITGEEVYSTIYAIEESPIEKGVIWVGANDGPVHVTRDAGKTWKNVTPKDLPPGGRVQTMDASPHRKGSAYVAVYRYLLNDFAPYIYATTDYGATWRKLTDGTNGIPGDSPTRVIREDPNRAGLLYAGTEFGLYVSFDDGRRWQRFNLNLPVTPVTDLKVHGTDLVVSTMGRGLWILDDAARLHQVPGGATAPTGLRLFAPSPAYRTRMAGMGGGPGEPEYPGVGAVIDYFFAAAPGGAVTLEILDGTGAVIRTVKGGGPPQTTQVTEGMRAPQFGRGGAAPLTVSAGGNRYVWNLQNDAGVLVVPGPYRLRLTAGAWSETQPLEVRIDPRLPKDGVTEADLQQQYDFNMKLRATINEARAFTAAVTSALQSATGERQKTLADVRRALVTATGYAYPQPMLNDQLSAVARVAGAADARVNNEAIRRYNDLVAELGALKKKAAM